MYIFLSPERESNLHMLRKRTQRTDYRVAPALNSSQKDRVGGRRYTQDRSSSITLLRISLERSFKIGGAYFYRCLEIFIVFFLQAAECRLFGSARASIGASRCSCFSILSVLLRIWRTEEARRSLRNHANSPLIIARTSFGAMRGAFVRRGRNWRYLEMFSQNRVACDNSRESHETYIRPQERKGERYRLRVVVDELQKATAEDYQTALLAFINCLVISTPVLKDRIRIRNEFIGE